jgi:G3E family GTPase
MSRSIGPDSVGGILSNRRPTVRPSPMATTPVSVVTGFLGSGKTTLLARLLRDSRLQNTAVIVNEFGEVGLDHALVEPISGEVVLLPQGCLCCSLNGDLSSTLERLDAQRDQGVVPAFDRVIVETTGLADPAPVLQTIIDRPLLLRGYRLGRVVTTVDGVNGGPTLDRHAEAARQVAVAERLLLTKTDLTRAEPLYALRQRLRELNPTAPIALAIQGEVDPEWATGVDDERAGMPTLHVLPNRSGPHAHVGHSHRIKTLALRFAEPLPYAPLLDLLHRLVSAHGEALLRVKGIVAIAGHRRPIVIDGVQHLFHPPRQLAAWPRDVAQSTIVFILDGLDPSVVPALAAASGLRPDRSGEAGDIREEKHDEHDALAI